MAPAGVAVCKELVEGPAIIAEECVVTEEGQEAKPEHSEPETELGRGTVSGGAFFPEHGIVAAGRASVGPSPGNGLPSGGVRERRETGRSRHDAQNKNTAPTTSCQTIIRPNATERGPGPVQPGVRPPGAIILSVSSNHAIKPRPFQPARVEEVTSERGVVGKIQSLTAARAPSDRRAPIDIATLPIQGTKSQKVSIR